jgi:hypothetical protein
MCYLARQHQAPVDDGVATRPGHIPVVRPRWVGAAVAAVLAAGFAAAALLAPESTAQAPADEAPLGVQPVVSKAPGAPGPERSSLSPDDGVPVRSDGDAQGAVQTSCHHAV